MAMDADGWACVAWRTSLTLLASSRRPRVAANVWASIAAVHLQLRRRARSARSRRRSSNGGTLGRLGTPLGALRPLTWVENHHRRPPANRLEQDTIRARSVDEKLSWAHWSQGVSTGRKE